ncbi:MAG: peptidoglycan DD-metalloendopeptidase family protein [Desulfobacteraceae bacterium]|nr:peptidoglycan DD-metalloendopeptidase family protein [Desulfobacteraceae bacterium]MCB9495022.1 peptidoglycan DD-metalloendopeptidase family protein [Desulfobacteraceae bacterium]
MLYFTETIFKKYLTLLAFAVLFFVFLSADAYCAKAVVKSSKLNMREGSLFGAPVTGILSKGDVLKIIGKTDGMWLKVSFEGKTGYIRNRPVYIEIIDQKDDDSKNLSYEKQKVILEKKIKKEKKILEEYREKSKTILTGLDEIDKAVNNAENKLASVKKDYIDLTDKIREQKRKIKEVEKEIESLQPFVDKRIVSLYKLSRVGQMNLLCSADSVMDFIKRQKALKKIISSDLSLIGKYSYYRKEYIDLSKSLEKEQEHLNDLSEKIAKYLRIKESEKEKKKALLREINEKEAVKISVISSLEEAAENLDEKLKVLGEKKADKNTESELRTFDSYKGLLNYPVKGDIISRFGQGRTEDGGVYAYKSGIGLKADIGEPVQSVFSGKVVFADWFKGYGNMLIIDHGNSFYTIYAHVQEYFKQKGDSVRKDEVIATIGETGSMDGPVLHFEVRHHGTPLNPLSWIKK